MSHFHAVVWIDHNEAHINRFTPDQSEKLVVHSSHKKGHPHHKKGTIGSGKASEDQGYYHEIATALLDAREILVVGPANAKDELVKHIRGHDKNLAGRIVGVESSDHPSDGQLLALARKYFKAADRMLPQGD